MLKVCRRDSVALFFWSFNSCEFLKKTLPTSYLNQFYLVTIIILSKLLTKLLFNAIGYKILYWRGHQITDPLSGGYKRG